MSLGEIFEFESRARSRSGITMASYRPCLFDCFQADGSVDEISGNDQKFLTDDRFSDSDSSDHVVLRTFQLQAGLVHLNHDPSLDLTLELRKKNVQEQLE